MPTFYNYTEDGQVRSIDDVFVPADAFRQGGLFTWGGNVYAHLGTNDTNTRCTPVTTFAGGANWKQVACGTYHVSAIKTDGTLWTWGYNAYGQLGINVAGSTTYRTTPVTTFAGGTNWKQVECGGNHTVAIKTDGTLWTWGNNNAGHLGNNTTTTRCTPVTTFAGGTNWKQVAGANNLTAAIKTDGTLWTWGNNGSGQLGINNTNTRCTPVTTFAGGTNWKQVACSDNHMLAIKTDGTLWVWGQNSYGKLGVNDTIYRSTPVTTFAGGTNWKQVGSRYQAIKTDGTLWTWGDNTNGQLGTGDTTTRCTPVTTFAGGTNWKQVAVGFNCALAIKTDGTLWGWGSNSDGALGINVAGGGIDKLTPVTTFAGGTNWKQVSCGTGFSAAVTYIDDYQ